MDYSVIQSNEEIRSQSRKQLRGAWGKMAFAFFIYFSINIICTYAFSERSPLYNPALDSFMKMVYIILFGPFYLGFFAGFFLKRIRGEEIQTENMFDGFNLFLPSLLTGLLMITFLVLWSLLLIIPGIIKNISYSMTFHIMYDNPKIKPLEALRKSEIMMKGYKMKKFYLDLSFIGWYFLGFITLGIGFIWIYPYIWLAEANFYENLRLKKPVEITVMDRGHA